MELGSIAYLTSYKFRSVEKDKDLTLFRNYGMKPAMDSVS